MITINTAFKVFILGIVLSFIYSNGLSLSLVTISQGFALAIFLAWFVSKIDLKPRCAFVIVGLSLFVIGMFNNMLEGYFFTKMYSSFWVFAAALPVPIFTAFLESALAIFLIGTKGSRDMAGAMKAYCESRTPVSWIKRMFAASVLYLPIYFLFGLAVSSFVIPIYSQNPELVIPQLSTIATLEIIRGAIYAVVLLLVFVAVGKDRKTNFVVASALLYIPGAALPLISAMTTSNFLSAVAPYHLIELFADSVVYAYAVSRLISADSIKRK
jgi:hypothetical protein